jgi:hypothetical protein
MKKNARVMLWIASTSIFLSALWFGYETGISGARNVAVFMLWFLVIASLAGLSDGIRSKMRAKGPPVPMWIDLIVDMSVTAFLVWNGHSVMAAFYLAHTIILHSAYSKPEKSE